VFVAVDWGTSSFRAWLVAGDGAAVAHSRSSEGMLHCAASGFAPVLRDHLARLGAPDGAPVLICGMAGARQGWVEAPYVETPTRLEALHEAAVRIDAPGDIRILPGIAQKNERRPEVMRGEETQILGAIEGGYTGLVCIPGTHSKWVRIEAGGIVDFTTFMTGELFSVLAAHSILAHAVEADSLPASPTPPFLEGLDVGASQAEELTALLFRLRAAQLLGFERRSDGASRLSGLLIGAEIAAATSRYGMTQRLRLLAAGGLGTFYEAAFTHLGFEVDIADAEQASLQGLSKAAMRIWREQAI
jgi:2-dehydro-3-deoxygalactonokinase